MSVAVGILLLAVGAAFMCWGAYSLLRPRRQSDVEWIESNPLSNWTLGGMPLGFDRMGGVASLLAGSVALILGVAVLLS